jgi:hypothetical protein
VLGEMLRFGAVVKWLAFAYTESRTAIMIQVVGRLP